MIRARVGAGLLGSAKRRRRSPRRTWLLLASLASLLVWGCGSSAPPTEAVDSDLYDRFFADEPIVVATGFRWQVAKGAPNRWRFLSRATLWVWVSERVPTEDPLIVTLQPVDSGTGPQTRERLGAEWNEISVDEWVSVDDGVVRLRVPAERLAPGLHSLQVLRRACPGCERESVYQGIAWESGEHAAALEPRDSVRWHQLADFLARGVVGKGPDRRSGTLFLGPGEHRVPVALSESRVLEVEPQNLSSAWAEFVLSAEEKTARTRLDPGELGALRVEVPAGTQQLSLQVQGEDAEGLFLWSMPRWATAPSPQRPPILLITLDTTRRDAVAPYSSRPELTPNLSELAAGATTFSRAFSTAPWTLPSHASAMTGLYPSKHGAGVSASQIAPHAPTLARLLRRAGYLTAGFSAGKLTSYRFGLGLGFSYYQDPDGFETKGEDLIRYVESFLDRYHEHPLFLFVNIFDPHASYHAPARHRERVDLGRLADAVRDVAVWGDLAAGKGGTWGRVVAGEAPQDPAGLSYLEAAYLAEVAMADEVVGRLLKSLRRHDQLDDTLVIITADHGELLGEGGYFSHSGRMDPELVEVPLLVKWPNQRDAHTQETLVSARRYLPHRPRSRGHLAPRE